MDILIAMALHLDKLYDILKKINLVKTWDRLKFKNSVDTLLSFKHSDIYVLLFLLEKCESHLQLQKILTF